MFEPVRRAKRKRQIPRDHFLRELTENAIAAASAASWKTLVRTARSVIEDQMAGARTAPAKKLNRPSSPWSESIDP